MPIPIVTIPKQGPIATRPRREALFDTEGWPSTGGNTISAKKSLFVNATSFAQTMGLSKIKGRDHNMDGMNGLLPKGQMFHWYGWRLKIRPMSTPMAPTSSTTPMSVFDIIRQIKETTWSSFYFGSSSLYLQLQTWQLPGGTGYPDCQHNQNATTYVGNNQDLDRMNNSDITLNGVPTEIGELEAYQVDIESNLPSGTTIVPPVDLYPSIQLIGMLFKGIQG